MLPKKAKYSHIISYMKELLKGGRQILIRQQNTILSAALVIMITYALSHLVGLVKTRLLISYFFGTKAPLLDVYYAAFLIPDTVFQLLVVGSLSAAFIPVFTRYLAKDEKTAWDIASSSLNCAVIAFLVASGIIFTFSKQLSQLIAPGFDSTQIIVMVSLLRVMLVAQLFFAVSGFMTGIIQSHKRFIIPAIAPVLYNLGIILGIVFLSPGFGIYGPAIGVVIGAFLHMGIQLPLAWHLGFRFRPVLNLSHPGTREIIKLVPPRSLALGVDQVEHLSTVFLSSLLVPGSLSMLNVARLLYAIPSSLFGVTIGQAALPTLSRQAVGDHQAFKKTLVESALNIIFLALPISILFIVLRIPIVRIVFGAPTFPWIATLTTGKTLAILTLSSVFTAVMQLVIRGFYALHDTKTPLLVGIFSAAFNVVLGISLVKIFNLGIFGLAAAISGTSILETITLIFLLSKKLKDGTGLFAKLTAPLLKMVTVGSITGISLWVPMRLLDNLLDTTRTAQLIVLSAATTIIGSASYFFFSYLFRIEETQNLTKLLSRILTLTSKLKTSSTRQANQPSKN